MLKSFSQYTNNLEANKFVGDKDCHVAFSLKGIPVMNKFVSRNTEITTLAQLLISNDTNTKYRKVCLLHGVGGVG